jgi:hypothetical protein
VSDSRAGATAYETLGVDPTASQDELRRAYRLMARRTHPDLGGSTLEFRAVQVAWEKVGDEESRRDYDRSLGAAAAPPDPARPTGSARPSQVRARSFGHPGALARERYVALVTEWLGRGDSVPDPYSADVVRSAPREIRFWLAKALAEEATATSLSELGIGYTIWNSVLTPRGGGIVDHIVLGPTGLFALRSEDWGGPVRLVRGDVSGEMVPAGVSPLRELAGAAKAIARAAGVRAMTPVVVVPDADGAAVEKVEHGRTRGGLLVQHSVLAHVLRTGIAGEPGPGVGEVFDLRTRLQQSVRLA